MTSVLGDGSSSAPDAGLVRETRTKTYWLRLAFFVCIFSVLPSFLLLDRHIGVERSTLRRKAFYEFEEFENHQPRASYHFESYCKCKLWEDTKDIPKFKQVSSSFEVGHDKRVGLVNHEDNQEYVKQDRLEVISECDHQTRANYPEN